MNRPSDFIGPEVHKRALETWGLKAQLMALVEELAEATAAASRVLNQKGTYVELVEELVDVESLRLSVETSIGTPEDWEAIRQKKRAKLLAKLDGGVRRV